ncbi:MAG: hypothetical protein N2C14_17775, partial [Planctomycetales bacterium]
KTESQREYVLQPNQVVTHVVLPPVAGIQNAAYEVRHGEGPDYPLAAAAVALRLQGGVVRRARVVMGHVAPTPWTAREAEDFLVGQSITPQVAEAAGDAAVRRAVALSENGHKIQMARVAVKRALLTAAGLETGGF